MEKTIKIRCPKCGTENLIEIRDNPDFESGLLTYAFLHRDHILVVYLDSTFFIRGAYIKPPSHISDHDVYFRDYKVLTRFIVGHKFQFALADISQKIIDIRACPSIIPNLYNTLDFIDSLLKVPSIQYSERRYNIWGTQWWGMRDKNYLFLALLTTDTDIISSWSRLLYRIITRKNPTLQNSILTKIIQYVDSNISHQPTERDEAYLESLLE